MKWICLSVWMFLAMAAMARAAPELCEHAARQAAAETGVPLDMLLAVALAETGRARGGQMRPWPWAANTGGPGHWFETMEAADLFARAQIGAGRRNIDLGCFQINWHWHGAQFESPRALLDPLTNARYAAGYLHRLRGEFGSWEGAVGAYHSRRPEAAVRYLERVRALRAGLTPPPTALERLAQGGGGAGPSLVVLAGRGGVPFVALTGAER